MEGRILSSSVRRDLLCLEHCTPVTSQSFNPLVSSVKTPLQFRAWKRALVQHPDWEFVAFEGLLKGFGLAITGHLGLVSQLIVTCDQPRRTLRWLDYLEEMAAGRVVDPLEM